jgi:hypothetical protein
VVFFSDYLSILSRKFLGCCFPGLVIGWVVSEASDGRTSRLLCPTGKNSGKTKENVVKVIVSISKVR